MADRADFGAMYAASPDPFGVASTWYEQRKQRVLLAGLTRPRYRLAWDCASGTGHLAAALAQRCDAVVATDATPAAVELTRRLTSRPDHLRTGSEAEVWCGCSALPDVPARVRRADLTVVAEVLYYLDGSNRDRAHAALRAQHGEIAAVHWRHHPHDADLSGAAVTEELDAGLGPQWRRVVRHDDEDFVLAVWLRGDPS